MDFEIVGVLRYGLFSLGSNSLKIKGMGATFRCNIEAREGYLGLNKNVVLASGTYCFTMYDPLRQC